MNTILAAIAADPNISPAFRAGLSIDDRRAQVRAKARAEYLAMCERAGSEPDFVGESEFIRRAEAKADGRYNYTGD